MKRLILVPDVDELFREQEVYGVKNIYKKAPNSCVVLYKPILEQTSPLQITLHRINPTVRTNTGEKETQCSFCFHYKESTLVSLRNCIHLK